MIIKGHWTLRYGLAVLTVLVAVWLRWVLTPLLGTEVAYITVFPAMMIIAMTLGAGPALVSTAVGIVLVEWLFVGPVGIELNLQFASRAVILSCTSIYVSWVSTRLRAARAQADTEAAAAHAAEMALRQQVELIDPVRAEIIAREMQRVVRDRERADVTPVMPVAEWPQRVPAVAGALMAATGVLVLLGWAFGIAGLKSVLPGLATMKANTALCFLLAGTALALRDRRGLRLVCAGIVCAVAGLTAAEYVTGWDFGIDQILFHDALDANTVYPGRMVPATVLCFMLSGAALLLLKTRRGWWAQQALVVGFGILGMAGLLGYAYEVKSLYQFAGHSSMALHTAAAFVALATGLLLARADGRAGVLLGPGPGTQLARRFLPVAILLPVLLGWLHLAGERSGIVDSSVGACLFALAMMLSLLVAGWWIAWVLNRADATRRATEAQLRHQSELMDHANEALIVRELGGVIRFWNQGAAALYGWPAAEVLGQRTYVLLRTEGVPVAEKDAQLARTGHWEGELTHTARDGRRLIVESRQTATHDADGHLLVLEADRDITERKQAEAAVRVSEDRLRFALETIQTGAWDLDLVDHTAFRSLEHDRIFGYAELLPQWNYEMFLEHVLPEDRATVDGKFRRAMELRGDWNFECRIRRADGQVRWILAAGRHRVDADGTPRRMAGIVQDITERKQAEAEIRRLNEQLEQRVRERTAELETANKELEAFCYSVSHDLRTPLRTIDGFSQAVLEDYNARLDDTGQDFLNRIRRGCQQMGQLIDDLLNLSCVTRNEMHREIVDLTAVAKEVVQQLRDSAPARNVQVRIAPGLAAVGDAPLLRAALFNLLENAWKFTAQCPVAVIEVGVEASAAPSASVFFIRDNGTGFDMQYADKLFHAFQRLHTTHEYPGTGIGLATVARVIRRHGGRIWAAAAVGRGATFYFTLEPEPAKLPQQK